MPIPKKLILYTKSPLSKGKRGCVCVNYTPYFVVATGTPGPIVEVTVQDFR